MEGLMSRIRLMRVGDRMAQAMRDGRDGINAQFQRQGTISSAGFTAWKPSKRALREGNQTLIDTGDYWRAWRGVGPGAIRSRRQEGGKLSIGIGVDRARFPQVGVFQAELPTIFTRGTSTWLVHPRPVSMNPGMLREAERELSRYLKEQD
jgi:hypothetical protein